MDQVLSLRPFVPARDFAVSKRFYGALGFRLSRDGEDVAMLKLGGCSFILQNFYHRELAENLMVQLMVRDADAWWSGVDMAALVAEFGSEVLAEPDAGESGFDIAAFLVPAAVVGGGMIAIWVAVARWRRRERGDRTPAVELNAADSARLEQDLSRYDP